MFARKTHGSGGLCGLAFSLVCCLLPGRGSNIRVDGDVCRYDFEFEILRVAIQFFQEFFAAVGYIHLYFTD